MDEELKIVVGPTTATTKVFVGERQIGLIQDIRFHASVDYLRPQIEIVFPDLFSIHGVDSPLVKSLQESIDLLKELPNVKVTLEKLEFDDA